MHEEASEVGAARAGLVAENDVFMQEQAYFVREQTALSDTEQRMACYARDESGAYVATRDYLALAIANAKCRTDQVEVRLAEESSELAA